MAVRQVYTGVAHRFGGIARSAIVVSRYGLVRVDWARGARPAVGTVESPVAYAVCRPVAPARALAVVGAAIAAPVLTDDVEVEVGVAAASRLLCGRRGGCAVDRTLLADAGQAVPAQPRGAFSGAAGRDSLSPRNVRFSNDWGACAAGSLEAVDMTAIDKTEQ